MIDHKWKVRYALNVRVECGIRARLTILEDAKGIHVQP
jgi:hypothetical protein